MSQANVELAKRSLDAYNRRDLEIYDELYTPDFEWVSPTTSAVEGGSYRGRAAFERYFAMVGETWDEFRVTVTDVREVGDRVLLLGRLEARGLGSGVPVDTPMGSVLDFRDGKISRVRAFLDHGEAFRAAGLSE